MTEKKRVRKGWPKGVKRSDEQRAKLSTAAKKQHAATGGLSKETKKKISEAKKGVPKSKSHKAAISASLTGTPHSKQRVSERAASIRASKLSKKLKGQVKAGNLRKRLG